MWGEEGEGRGLGVDDRGKRDGSGDDGVEDDQQEQEEENQQAQQQQQQEEEVGEGPAAYPLMKCPWCSQVFLRHENSFIRHKEKCGMQMNERVERGRQLVGNI